MHYKVANVSKVVIQEFAKVKWLKVNTVLLLTSVLSFVSPAIKADTQFRVIVDASGSMLISDPDRLTSEALRLISNLAPEEEATLGVWLFGEVPRVLLPEAPINKDTKAKLENYLNSYVTEDVQTDLEAIITTLLNTPDTGDLDAGFNRHWILVTDGMVDVSLDDAVNQASRHRLLNELTEKLVEKDIHLHTISMTGYTDEDLLEDLSVKTDATHTEVAVPEDLLDTFDRIFAQASPSDEIPFDGNTFFVDSAIDELTLVVFHENGIQPQIVKPNGQTLSLVNNNSTSVAASEHYTLISVLRPDDGEWQVNNVDLERSSIRVITHLSAQATVIAPVLFQDEPIFSTVGLFEKDTLIEDNDILNLLTVKQTLVRFNGEKQETISTHEMAKAKSQFKKRIPGISEPGHYALISLVDGKTFARQLSQHFTVHPGILFEGVNSGGNLLTFTAKPESLRLNMLRSNVQIEVVYGNGEKETKLMSLLGEGYWESTLSVNTNTKATVRARLVGVTQTGLRFDYWTPYWNYVREGDQIPVLSKGTEAPVAEAAEIADAMDEELMPSIAPADLSIVNELNSTAPSTENLVEAEDIVEEESEALSTQEWAMYLALNFIGILVLGGGIFLYLVMKKNRKLKRDDVENV